MATLVVANTKGGVGKSIISTMVLPVLFVDEYKEVNVYEIDDNNKTSSNLKNKNIDNLNFKSIKIEDMEEDIDKVKLDEFTNAPDILNIIDCGGGNDTIAIVKHLAKSDLYNLTYIVPTNEDLEQFTNLKDTIALIKNNDATANIVLILNRAKSLSKNDVQKQFINLYGSNQYGIDERFSEIESDVNSTFVVKDSHLYGIVKNVYKRTLADMYPEFKELIDNSREHQQKWANEGKEYFMQMMKFYRVGKDVIELVEELKPLKKEIKNDES